MENNFFSSQKLLVFLIVVIFIALLLYLRKIKKKKYKPQFNDTMPANLWFYSQLVNLEIDTKNANYNKLKKIFLEFLYRKYHISKFDLEKKSIFLLVKEKEENMAIIDLYGEIWNSIEDLKQSDNSDVILFIKSIKLNFNKDGYQEWVKSQKQSKPCNNC